MDDFIFTPLLNSSLAASDGAGSRVTEREGKKGGDKSVTLAAAEKKIIEKFYSNFPRMSVAAAAHAGFEFRLYPSGRKEKLKIVHPKPSGNETRIYFKKGILHPKPLDFWAIFEKSGEPWIGVFSEAELEQLNQGASLNKHNGLDQLSEDDFQSSINSTVPTLVQQTTTTYQRDPSVSANALKNSGYRCELMPELVTFQSRVTSKPYLEAHHLFPIFEQRNFPDQSLDVVDNICILNPYAHRLLHHATYGEIEPQVRRLFEARKVFFNTLDITLNRVLESYR